MKIYKSKYEIHKDYEIAIKFRLKYDVSQDAYDRFFAALRANDNWRIIEFNREVHHLNAHYPISVGLFAEIPIVGDNGRAFSVRFVLLEHESGPEFFLTLKPLIIAGGKLLGATAARKIADTVLKNAVLAIKSALRDRWPSYAMRLESPIWYAEIRTASKGKMRIKYKDLEPTQITCLVRHYPQISDISECNAKCFGGQLFAADDECRDDGI